MKHLTCLLLLAGAGCAVPVTEAEPRRPTNVLLILSDDHRDDHLGVAGHPVLQTPHLDRLAAEGVRFRNAFVTTPICASSRATVLTGLAEHAHGSTFGTPPLRSELARQSYPALLRRAGYRTGFVGKFGVRIQRPDRAGMFDSFRSLLRTPYWKKQDDGTRRHVTDLIGDAALDFLAAGDDRPWCLSVSFNAGHAEDGDKEDHYPWPDAEDGLYDQAVLPRPALDAPADHTALPAFLADSMGRVRYGWRWDTEAKYDRNLRAYYRLLTGMDRNVGRLLEALERLGLRENTLVVFMGDNGYAMAERGLAGKWTHYEESLRVPLIVAGPGVKAGRVEDRIALNTDLAPTVLTAAGIALPTHLSGASLDPLLRGAATAWRTGFRCEHGFDPGNIPRWVGFRTAQYKFARYVDQEPPFEALYDLEADPLEQRNLAPNPRHTATLAEMRMRAMDQGPPVRAPIRRRQQP